MTVQTLVNPLPQFFGADGQPLTSGYVYIGQANQDPRQYTSDVFYDEDMTVPASQPLRTVGGYIVRNGSPTNVWMDEGSHSLMVLDSYQRQVVYVASFLGSLPATVQQTTTVDRFSGTGAQTVFALSVTPVSENDTEVFVSGIYQQKNTYSVSGNVLTFAVAPAAGTNNIEVNTVVRLNYASISADIADQVTAAEAAADAALTASEIGSSGFNYRGDWVTATLYNVGDVFRQSGVDYVTLTTHSSGTFATDLAANKFRFFYAHREVWIETFGGKSDGTNVAGANDTAMTQALAYLHTIGGGTLRFRPGTYRFDSTINLPNSGEAIPRQVAIEFKGAGCWWTGNGVSPYGGTYLDLRGGDADGKIQTRGSGIFKSEGITYTNLGTADTFPIIKTTNTTLHLRGNAFMGHSSKSGISCDQDAIILGGYPDPSPSGADTAPFQGYGSIIEGNYFDRIKTGVFLGMYCNGSVVSRNTSWTRCGNASGAFIEIDGDPGLTGINTAVGNLIEKNLMEVGFYQYGIRAKNATKNMFLYNDVYDPTGVHVAAIRLEATAGNSLVITSFGAPGGYLSEASPSTQVTHVISVSDEHWKTNNLDIRTAFTANQTTFRPVATSINGIEPVGTMASGVIWYLKSGTTDANPDAAGIRFQWKADGSRVIGGNGAGNVTNNLATGANYWNNGRGWGFNGVAGGNMEISSGTGGATLTMQHASIVYKSQGGVTQFTQTMFNAQGFEIDGDVTINTAGKGRRFKTGANGKVGSATLVAGTVTVANTSVTANSIIFLSRSTTGGTPGHLSYTKINATSFTINSSSGTDTSTINYEIVETY